MSDELTKERKAAHFALAGFGFSSGEACEDVYRAVEKALATARNDALEEAEPHLAEIDEVAEWINSTLPIPTFGATKMLGKLLDATAAIRALKSETKP